MDGRTSYGRADGLTHPLLEMQQRILQGLVLTAALTVVKYLLMNIRTKRGKSSVVGEFQ